MCQQAQGTGSNNVIKTRLKFQAKRMYLAGDLSLERELWKPHSETKPGSLHCHRLSPHRIPPEEMQEVILITPKAEFSLGTQQIQDVFQTLHGIKSSVPSQTFHP